MNNRYLLITAASAVIGFSTAGFAQYNPPGDLDQPVPGRDKDQTRDHRRTDQNDQNDMQSAPMQMQLQRLSKLMDADVKSAQNEDLGEIENFAINPNQGQVEFAILSVSGKDIAVPWQVLRFRQTAGEKETVVASVSRDQLTNAPTLPNGRIDRLSDQQFSDSIYKHFNVSRTSNMRDTDMHNVNGGDRGVPQSREPMKRDQDNPGSGFEENNPPAQRNPNQNVDNDQDRDQDVRNQRNINLAASATLVSAKDLLDSDIKTAQNNDDLGEVEDALVDSASGNIAFIVLSSGGFLGLGEDLRAVPFQAFDFRKGNVADHRIALNASKAQLENAPTFKKSDWATMTANSNWTNNVYSHYGVQAPTGAYGYVPPQGTSGSGNNNASAVISGWPQAAQQAAQEMIQKYGQPDGVTTSMLTWNDKGQWARIIAYRNEVQHNFPMPHKDVLEQSVYFKVPADKIDELANFDGSVIVYRTDGLLSARCNSEAMNILALNLANDIITGKRSADEARNIYAQTAQQFQQGQSSPMTQQLQFQPSSQNRAAEPDSAGGRGQSGSNRQGQPSSNRGSRP